MKTKEHNGRLSRCKQCGGFYAQATRVCGSTPTTEGKSGLSGPEREGL